MRLTLPLALLLLGLATPSLHAGPFKVGPAFSDPAHREPMDEKWQQQPIRYKDVPADTDLVVTLDQHLYPALKPLIQAFARQNGLRIAVGEGTCGISAGALLDKKVDIGGFCCPAGEVDRLPGLRYHTLGIGALALIVHPDNPIADVSLEQARQIFSGELGNWNQLPGAADTRLPPINAVTRLHCKNRPGHWRLILNDEDQFSAVATEVATIPDMIAQVGGSRQAIGYESLWMISSNASQGRVKTLRIDGIDPADAQALVSGRYPFYRTYQLASWTAPGLRKEQADRLLAYIRDHFDEVAGTYGLIPSPRLEPAGWRFQDGELVAGPAIR